MLNIAESTPKFFIPQSPCEKGHLLRYSRSGECVPCKSMKKTGKDTWEQFRQYFRSDYASNPTQHMGPFDSCVCIPLTHGHHTLIDAEDFDKISDYAWMANSKTPPYVQRTTWINGKTVSISFHRVIIEAPGLFIDHKNGNPLDNRKSNLRVCNAFQNRCNSAPAPGSSSQYKGVFWSKARKKWAAQIGGKPPLREYLGSFDREEDAAKAYDAAALQKFGEWAWLNFPMENPHVK